MGYSTLIFAILFILLSILNPAFAQNACAPSSDSCEFYSCMEQYFQCGSKGYIKKFGHKNCLKYVTTQPLSSRALQTWYPKVRICLQEKFLEIADATNGIPNSCQHLSAFAFQSHANCFLSNGFCNLNFIDKLAVAAVAGLDVFLPESLATQQVLNEACSSQ